jgi:ABC-type antimicrobial peptide transport system permease subunit
MALGATSGAVVRGFAKEALVLVAVGALAGLVLAGAAAQMIAGYLYGVNRLDPIAFVTQSLVLLAAAAAATLVPAWRALRVQPIQALRQD